MDGAREPLADAFHRDARPGSSGAAGSEHGDEPRRDGIGTGAHDTMEGGAARSVLEEVLALLCRRYTPDLTVEDDRKARRAVCEREVRLEGGVPSRKDLRTERAVSHERRSERGERCRGSFGLARREDGAAGRFRDC
jgi:hypothetical protein